MKNKLIQISAWIAAHITLVVVLVTAVALFLPSSFNWIDTSAITPMLGVVMFGMGLTLRPSDFRPVLQHPKDILVGELAQFLIMPSLAWLLCKLLSLPEELALGVILVGCCPGGTASNVICYLAKGDVALSVAMTGVSTLLAPIVTPALVWLLAGESVEVDVAGMFLSIVQVVIVPHSGRHQRETQPGRTLSGRSEIPLGQPRRVPPQLWCTAPIVQKDWKTVPLAGRNLTLKKRLCVSMITQGRFTENSFTFYFKRKGVFFRSINSVFFNGSHHIVTPSKLQPKQLPH